MPRRDYRNDVRVTPATGAAPGGPGQAYHAPTGLARVFSGSVAEGRRLGRRLGVPTANLPIDGLDPVLWGSWAALTRTAHGDVFRALAHLGVRPSVDGGRPLVEAHLLGFDGDLYGSRLTVCLLERVAMERTLPSLDALQRKIHEDLRLVRAYFARTATARTGSYRLRDRKS